MTQFEAAVPLPMIYSLDIAGGGLATDKAIASEIRDVHVVAVSHHAEAAL